MVRQDIEARAWGSTCKDWLVFLRKTVEMPRLTIFWQWWVPVMAFWTPGPCGKAEER